MTWAKNYVLVPDSDGRGVKKLANAIAARYGATSKTCFSDVPFDAFQLATQDCAQSDTGTKVMICGHGCKYGLNGKRGADNIAQYLDHLGVKTVGLISFKACDMGQSVFLADFAFALRDLQIPFGYLIAYRKGAWLASKGTMRGFWGDLEIKGSRR